MKRPTAASLKRVNAENLAKLGVERLAEILIEVAAGRADVKRRLRMELAAEQGAEHLLVEVDKRLASIETSRGKVSWRRRAGVLRDLDDLRGLIVGRLADLDRAAGLDRMLQFMNLAAGLSLRVRDKDGAMEEMFALAAGQIGPLATDASAAPALAHSLAINPGGWARWLPILLEAAPPKLAQATLAQMAERKGAAPSWFRMLRALADAAGEVDAFAATFSKDALKTQPVAAEVARRLIAAARIAEAVKLLEAARPKRPADIDADWEAVWIEGLEATGQGEAAQAARWTAFERTLAVEPAREFTRRLADFDDVEAEAKAFAYAAAHKDAALGLAFLMDWPALPEAARMIAARADDLDLDPELAETWAAKLRARQPAAALILLRKGAAIAFSRRQFATCDRLTAEAETLD